MQWERDEARRERDVARQDCGAAKQEIEALREIAGNDVVALIKPQPDEAVAKIVAGWPRDFAPERARMLGFTAEASFAEIVRQYVEDELGQL